MPDVSARTDVDRRPVIYAGRFVGQIAGASLPGDCIVLGEQDALSHKLTRVLEGADTLVLLDLLSFPLEALTDDNWDIPIIVALPSGFDVESLTTDFGHELFERLGPFDRIIAPDPALWHELCRKYRWAECQRVSVMGNRMSEVAETVCTLLATESPPPTTSESDGIDRGLRFNKALHRAQVVALDPWFAATRGKRDTKVPLDVLQVGTGVGRWASNFDPAKTRFVGIEAREDLVKTARANFPDHRFDRLGSDLLFPYEDESFDVVFSVTVMHHNPAPAKRTLLSEMWRVARPGGRLLLLENFVFMGEPEEPVVYPMSVTEFVDLVLDATAGQVVLEHAESLRYPGEDLHRGGLISLLRLGVSTRQ
jgi:SAM-dependent methyltransferase